MCSPVLNLPSYKEPPELIPCCPVQVNKTINKTYLNVLCICIYIHYHCLLPIELCLWPDCFPPRVPHVFLVAWTMWLCGGHWSSTIAPSTTAPQAGQACCSTTRTRKCATSSSTMRDRCVIAYSLFDQTLFVDYYTTHYWGFRVKSAYN